MKIFTILFVCLSIFINNLNAQTGTSSSKPIKIKLNPKKYSSDSANQSKEKTTPELENAGTTPPIITIIEPALERGKKITLNEKNINIVVKVTDENGISMVLVNGIEAKLSRDRYYRAEIILQEGPNIITVKATDRKNNNALENFIIVCNLKEQSNLNIERNGKDYALLFATDKYK